MNHRLFSGAKLKCYVSKLSVASKAIPKWEYKPMVLIINLIQRKRSQRLSFKDYIKYLLIFYHERILLDFVAAYASVVDRG